jgi:heme exporter protein C
MKTTLPWLLWLWIAAVLVGAWLVAPPLEGFVGGGESSRMLFFHVPMAWTSFVAFFAAGVSSIRYLMRRESRFDHASRVSVELGLIFCLLATLTGALWAKVEWGAYWNWDPRQLTITIALVFYAAYLALRGAIQDLEVRRRLAAAYAVLGLVVAPFLFFVAPRMAAFSLHPEPVLNAEGELRMDFGVLAILIGGSLGFMALFFWMRNLGTRLGAVVERNEEDFWEVVER